MARRTSTMKPIVIKGADAARAVRAAAGKSLKNGRTAEAYRAANSKAPIIVERG